MKALMRPELQCENIVKFHKEVYVKGQLCMEFELLDIDLDEFNRKWFPKLDEIALVVQQVCRL